jgi:hypothetical protein
MGNEGTKLSVGARAKSRLRRLALLITAIWLAAMVAVSGYAIVSLRSDQQTVDAYDSFERATLLRAEHSFNAVGSRRGGALSWRTISYEFIDREGQRRAGTHRYLTSVREHDELLELRYDRDDPSRVLVSWERAEAAKHTPAETSAVLALLALVSLLFPLTALTVAPLRKLERLAADPLPLLARIIGTRADGKGRVLVEYQLIDGPRPVRGVQWFDVDGPGAPWFGDAERTTIVAISSRDGVMLELLQQSGEPFRDRAALEALLAHTVGPAAASSA